MQPLSATFDHRRRTAWTRALTSCRRRLLHEQRIARTTDWLRYILPGEIDQSALARKRQQDNRRYLSFPAGLAGERALPGKTALDRRLRHGGGVEGQQAGRWPRSISSPWTRHSLPYALAEIAEGVRSAIMAAIVMTMMWWIVMNELNFRERRDARLVPWGVDRERGELSKRRRIIRPHSHSKFSSSTSSLLERGSYCYSLAFSNGPFALDCNTSFLLC